MKLRWTQRARRDLIAIGLYIAEHSKTSARRWVGRLRLRAHDALEAPMTGRIVPEFDRKDVREFILGNYRIVYRVLQREIHVLTVFEGHMLMRLKPDDVDKSA